MGQSVLSISGATLARIAARTGTPVFVYSAEAIRAQMRALEAALAEVPHRIHYSVKANSSLAILALVRDLGAGVDIVSGGELARVLRCGFPAGDIVFSGVGKRPEELAAAVAAGVGLINLESEGELAALASVLPAGAPRVAVGIRVNPDVTTETHPYTQTGKSGMKFGVPLDQVVSLARRVADTRGLELRALGMHIGSQITSAEPYRSGAERLLGLVRAVQQEGITSLTTVDVGGGLGIAYGSGPALDPAAFASAVAPLARSTGLTLLVEPGRFLVGNAGVLLTRVLYHKRSGGREILVMDAGMNDFIRPSLYQAHHEVCVVDDGEIMLARPHASRIDGAAGEGEQGATVDIVGPNCESGDFLALGRQMPLVAPGALLAVLGAGAYGFGMGSNYNSRPRAAEVLLEGDRFGVIRERERPEDLMRGETTSPRWETV
ncbi:MAG TPA: diaminopimelate decarboxylase [Gemmatimonadales bacterium]|nr:diaminopimelate decarboxylase [Gemmatimonadales bacterium]